MYMIYNQKKSQNWDKYKSQKLKIKNNFNSIVITQQNGSQITSV